MPEFLDASTRAHPKIAPRELVVRRGFPHQVRACARGWISEEELATCRAAPAS